MILFFIKKTVEVIHAAFNLKFDNTVHDYQSDLHIYLNFSILERYNTNEFSILSLAIIYAAK